MVFVRTQRMHLRFSYVDNGELRTQQLSSDHVWYILQKNLQHMIRVQKPLYHSSLSLLLDRVVQEKKRRVLMIVSDFLDISAYDVQRLKLLSQDYQVILLRLRIDSLE